MAQTLNEAAQAMNERDKALAKVFDEIEVGLTLLGATAVEDKLQEGVQETLEILRGAGIKVSSVLYCTIFDFGKFFLIFNRFGF